MYIYIKFRSDVKSNMQSRTGSVTPSCPGVSAGHPLVFVAKLLFFQRLPQFVYSLINSIKRQALSSILNDLAEVRKLHPIAGPDHEMIAKRERKVGPLDLRHSFSESHSGKLFLQFLLSFRVC
jgi:hypothetical protein